MNTPQEQLEIIRAFESGRTIECLITAFNEWVEIDAEVGSNVYWDWRNVTYRIAPNFLFIF